MPKLIRMTDGPSLRDVLARGWWLLAASLAIGLALALVAAARVDKVYEASVTLHVHTGSGRARDAQAAARTDAALLVDRSFLEQVAPRLRVVAGKRLDAEALRDRLHPQALPGTELVRLRAEGPSPEDARGLAADVADAFVVFLRQDALQRNASIQDDLRAQLTRLNGEIAVTRRKAAGSTTAAEQLSALQAQRVKLIAAQQQAVAGTTLQTHAVTEPAPAAASAHAIRPQRALYVAAGLLLGLVAGIGLAWLRATTVPVELRAEDGDDLPERSLVRS